MGRLSLPCNELWLWVELGLRVTFLQEELNDERWKEGGCERKRRGSERLYIGQPETIHSLSLSHNSEAIGCC